MNLTNKLFQHLTEKEIDKVCRIGHVMVDEKGEVFLVDVVLAIFKKGLEQWDV